MIFTSDSSRNSPLIPDRMDTSKGIILYLFEPDIKLREGWEGFWFLKQQKYLITDQEFRESVYYGPSKHEL